MTDLKVIGREHPWLAELVDPIRWHASEAELSSYRNEFDDDTFGRGNSYRSAQRDRMAREVGIVSLLRSAGCATGRLTVLDAFGGDGLVADVWAAHGGTDQIITADISATMVRQAVARGLPALRQAAHRMVLADETVDTVLMAYGTHHLDVASRLPAFAEAHRVLRPGGRIVVHDFDEQSPMSVWFGQIVHRHSPTGHPYRLFDHASLMAMLTMAGFVDVTIAEGYDPFRIHRPSAGAAVIALAEHLMQMYGLSASVALNPRGLGWLIRQCSGIFRLPAGACGNPKRLTVRRAIDGFVAELPRMALVATASKRLTSEDSDGYR